MLRSPSAFARRQRKLTDAGGASSSPSAATPDRKRLDVTTLDAALSSHRWRGLPRHFGSRFACGGLVLTAIAHGYLQLALQEGELAGARAWKTDRVLLTISPLGLRASDGGRLELGAVPFAPMAGLEMAASVDGALDEQLCDLDRLLERQERLTARVDACRAECLRMAHVAGRADVVDRLMA